MQIAIIGGTGYVGIHVCERLIEAGHRLSVLTRPGSEHKACAGDSCTIVNGDIGDEDALRALMKGAAAVIYLIGILRESPSEGITFDALQRRGAERAIALAEEAGASRFLLMSANGVDAAETPYQTTKLAAEERLKASSLRWTVFRPSIIFGDPRGRMEFCTQLQQELIESPLPAPLFFPGLSPLRAGGFRLAPVHVQNVAEAFSRAIADDGTSGRTYDLCGPDALTWRQILEMIAAASGRSKTMLPAPAMLIEPIAGLLGRFNWFPVTRDQLRMLLSGNTCARDGLNELGIEATPLSAATLAYLNARESSDRDA